MTKVDYTEWNRVTAELPWGVQSVLKDTLELVAAGDVKMVYGRDYGDQYACLINTVAALLKSGGGHGIPMMHFAPLVSLFDRINGELRRAGVNTDEYVSPLAAEVLLRYFAPIRPKPVEESVNEATQMEAFANNFVLSETDADYAREWLNSLTVKQANDFIGTAP